MLCSVNGDALSLELMADDAEPTGGRPVYASDECVVPGCSAARKKRSGGHGFCGRHAKNFYTHGHPETLLEKRRDEFLEAALAHEPGTPSLVSLAVAAVRWVGETLRTNTRGIHAGRRHQAAVLVLRSMKSLEAQRLSVAAMNYRECPAEASTLEFMLRTKRLEEAAKALFWALPAEVPAPPAIVREYQIREAA